MNEATYLKKLVYDPNWDKKNVEIVSLDDIVAGPHQVNNAARANGLNPFKLEQLMYEIETDGQLVPVSASKLRNGKWELNDGGHRFRALTDLRLQHPKNKKYSTIRLIAESHPSAEERNLRMLNDNRRYTSNEATDDDVIFLIHRNIADLKALGTDIDAITIEKVREYVKENIFPTPHGNKVNSLSRKVYAKLDNPSSKFIAPVNDKETMDQFNDNNPWGMQLPTSGLNDKGKYNWGSVVDDDKGQSWAVYNCNQETWVRQNVSHYSLKKKLQRDCPKILVIAYNNNLRAGDSDECPVQSYRKNVQKHKDYWNSHRLITEPLIDRLVFLPQVVTGPNKEDMRHLYTAKGKKIV
jgi:hypothetical protein